MLLRFEVSNHRSIYDPVELSMIAVDEDRPAARSFERLHERVLTIAGIYGPNASGKSNVLDAIAWLSSAVRGSLVHWDEEIPQTPFRFLDGPDLPSTFEVDMMVRGVRYSYFLTLNASAVLSEGLYSYPERRRRVLFEREGSELQFRRGLKGLIGTRELLTSTTLALSAAMRFAEPEISNFGRSLGNIGILNLSTQRWYPGRAPLYSGVRRFPTERLFYPLSNPDQPRLFTLEDDDSGDAALALTLLRFADLGIDDVQVVEEQRTGEIRESPRKRVQLLHRVGGEQIPFDMFDESEGTRTWFRLIGPVLHALRSGRLLVVDEIDASLHPRISAKLLELFQDPAINRQGAQLVFTSHDTSLLNHLNRDEVWLTEKGPKGATSLTALAEYGGDLVRRSLNLERAYLQGRFGAVPEIDQHLVQRALGLTSELSR